MEKSLDKESVARKNVLRKGSEAEGIAVKGYDFDKGVDYNEIVRSFSSTGFQASLLAKAVDITNKMIKDKSFVYLGYTSNMVSSGLRDVFRYLVKNKKVNLVVTTAGAVEEDIMKCMGDFFLGDFKASGTELREKGINRIGNIFVSNSRYVEFEEFFQELLEEIYSEQKKTGKIITASELVWKLGEKINDERSICYWAWKNKIKIFCPAITDGAIGDNIWFFKYRRPDFIIDVAEDIKQMNDSVFGQKKTGAILLGSGVAKHHILNANMFKNGLDYAVYINNSQEFDGSDAGALPEEAVSWGKILPGAENVKVFGDATILFPLLVAETFAK
ncbi:MAG: deoxyhypusine synthase [Nanoarchaeota archaeon]